MQAEELKYLSHEAVIKKVAPMATLDNVVSGIPAAITLAQFIIESFWGRSPLASASNNCFGMKKNLSGNNWPGSTWTGKSMTWVSSEASSGETVRQPSEFRVYASVEDSIADHSAYLAGAMNGTDLRYKGLRWQLDYRTAAQIIKDGGYATAPDYVEVLCAMIERYNLTQYNVAQPPFLVRVTVPMVAARKGPGIVGTNKLGEDFGMTTSHFILVHDDLTATEVSDLCDELKDVDGITQVVSLDSITGPGFQTELLPDSIMEILQSGGYKLILANSSYKTGTDAINNQLDEMISLIKTVDPEGVITGEGAMTKDLIEVADVDFKNVNVWSIMAVLVIIAVSFKSISIPALLVASIEAAIAINMGIPYFTGTQLPFIASIVIGTIQLGATVDYSILMTTRYHEERAFGRTPKEAAQQSLEHCSQSILTSGLTFFAATVGVAAISKMELLKSICLLISRGALISMVVILVMLPAALMLCDWIIRHTTLKWMVPESANAKKSEKE